MAVTWNVFEVDASVVAPGGEKISYKADKSGADYSVLQIDDKGIKLDQATVQDLIQMLSSASFRMRVK